jgi:hypothetical protein
MSSFCIHQSVRPVTGLACDGLWVPRITSARWKPRRAGRNGLFRDV